jgi:hypothetical protein
LIKVYENFELSIVGQLQSLLEANGIRTFLKNEFAAGALGELPFVEVCPQLFVLKPVDLPEANRLIRETAPLFASPEPGTPWTCAKCGAEVNGELAVCWKCGAGE